MNRIRRICRCLAGLPRRAGALAASAAAAPALLAPGPPLPHGHWTGPVYKAPVHTIAIGGMPGWQIALIAAGVALLAAVLAVIAHRARTARRRQMAGAG